MSHAPMYHDELMFLVRRFTDRFILMFGIRNATKIAKYLYKKLKEETKQEAKKKLG